MASASLGLFFFFKPWVGGLRGGKGCFSSSPKEEMVVVKRILEDGVELGWDWKERGDKVVIVVVVLAFYKVILLTFYWVLLIHNISVILHG